MPDHTYDKITSQVKSELNRKNKQFSQVTDDIENNIKAAVAAIWHMDIDKNHNYTGVVNTYSIDCPPEMLKHDRNKAESLTSSLTALIGKEIIEQKVIDDISDFNTQYIKLASAGSIEHQCITNYSRAVDNKKIADSKKGR
ncbi:MAG: hypothetical protein R3D71_06445 [Rickettsiales bacterium]